MAENLSSSFRFRDDGAEGLGPDGGIGVGGGGGEETSAEKSLPLEPRRKSRRAPLGFGN